MPRSLPPLTSLRAFEAAARSLSFTRAARELHVTPAAISHQIRGLEKYLGVALFQRNGNLAAYGNAVEGRGRPCRLHYQSHYFDPPRTAASVRHGS